jgi:hypothetical protein
MRNRLPLEVCNKVTEAVTNTIPGLLDYAINPLRQASERQSHEYMVDNTLLERKMDEISQRVHQDINTAFQSMRLEHSQAQISYSNLKEDLSKNAGELRMVGATITDLLEIYNKTRNDITSAGRQAARQNAWAEAGRHFRQLYVPKVLWCYLRLVLIVLTVSVSLQRRFMSYSANYGMYGTYQCMRSFTHELQAHSRSLSPHSSSLQELHLSHA